jgi:energy-coupling factor transporter ATP-binding protein EcfA2
MSSPTTTQSALVLTDLSFQYPGGRTVLSQLTAELPVGARLAIIGPSGAGKSTLLMHLNGLLPQPVHRAPTTSPVRVLGQPVWSGTLATIRRQVGFVFQDPDDQLFAATVGEDVAYGPRLQGQPRETIDRLVTESLAAVGLPDVGSAHPGQLSYGERKRVALAGVLACRPELLVLDEPSSNLDPRARRQLMGILRNLSATLVLATHDLDLVLDLCDHVWLLDGGRLQAQGPPKRLLSDPVLMERHGLEVPWRLRPQS